MFFHALQGKMRNKQRMNDVRRQQLCLLLLVPWLWLSGFSEAMHHHALLEGVPVAVASASSSHAPHAISVSLDSQTAPVNALCAICQWQHSSQAHIFAPTPLIQVTEAISVHRSYAVALLSRESAISRSRGPPSC